MIKVIHVAGPMITLGNRAMQRCAWCGFELINFDGDETATVGPGPVPWPEYELIEVASEEGGRYVSTTTMGHPTTPLPVNCCAWKAPQAQAPNLRLVK